MKKESKKEWYERITGQGFGGFKDGGTTYINGVLTEQAKLLTEDSYYLITEGGDFIVTE